MERNFILKNQDGHYWGRGKEWVDGSDRTRVAQYKHRDEASNTVFELSSKDFGLRAEILEVQLKDGKLPKLGSGQGSSSTANFARVLVGSPVRSATSSSHSVTSPSKSKDSAAVNSRITQAARRSSAVSSLPVPPTTR